VPSRRPRPKRAPTKTNLSFGARVRTLREREGWSQEELAHKAAIHVTYLSGLERGHRNPTLSVVARLAAALDMTPSDLLETVPGA
jgi:transcriptional regulator with XRE-family HTH domain